MNVTISELVGEVEEIFMGLKEILQQAIDTLNMEKNHPEYTEKFNYFRVREARNKWHDAAEKVDILKRQKASEKEVRAAEAEEMRAHREYLRSKKNIGILEKQWADEVDDG